MNKLLLSTRSLAVACAMGLPLWSGFNLAMAQAPRPIESADFIVAVVNSEPITNNEVQMLRSRMEREAAARGGERPGPQELTRLALEQLINTKAQLQQAKESGIKIDDEALDQAEMNVASSNQISREELRKRLPQEGLTLAGFREQLREQLTLARLREREVEGRVRVSDSEIDEFIKEKSSGPRAAGQAEINLAMILIAVPENSNDAQIQALQQRAQDVAARARRGEAFADLARTFSEAFDKGAKGGEMGLRSTDRYPELFVQATQGLSAHGIAGPVRSGAGFHILKLLERREPPPAALTVTQTRARHILLRASPQLTRDQAVARLADVRRQILSGRTSFARAAQEISQDGSASQGGDLGWASPGQFVPEFEQVMNKLGPQQISDPLVSRFGVHIIEVLDRRNVALGEREQRELARAALREKKMDEAYTRWSEDIRGRAYVEMREPATIAPVRSQ